jgi:ElaB/YqjD/DUF883 family membrane-anchored ribosome-binding protein
MPIQKKKKKKPKAQKEKTPAVSQKVTQIVRVNVGDTKPKPRRRRPAKKKDAAFSFGGGGGGGSGLAPVVQAPQVTQDVLQESKELRRIVADLKPSPQQQSLLGMEQGGQNETQLLAAATQQGFGNIARMMVDDKDEVTSRVTNLEDVFRGEAQRIKEQTQEASNKAERAAVDTKQRLDELHDLTAQVTHGFLQTAELTQDIGRRQMRQAPLDRAVGRADETDDEDDASTVQADDPAPPLTPGRGRGLTEQQKQMIRDDIVTSGMSVNEYSISGRNPIGTGAISKNTLNSLFRGTGGLKGYKERLEN